jgi:cyanophycin synthetase
MNSAGQLFGPQCLQRNHPLMGMHRVQGRRVICLDGDWIVGSEGGVEQRIWRTEIHVTQNGAIDFQTGNAKKVVKG